MAPFHRMVLLNGNIITMDPTRPRAEALGIVHGRIASLGQGRKVLSETVGRVRVADLGGRTVVPGFIDCHAHFLSMGVWKGRLELERCASAEGLLSAVKRWTGRLPRGSWVLGRGWDESRWPDKRSVDRRELDAAAPRAPVMIIRVCGHVASVNSRALAVLMRKLHLRKGPDVDPERGLISEGALERAREFLGPTDAEMASGLARSFRLAARLGVTSVHDIIGKPELGAYQAARAGGRLGVRACLHLEGAAVQPLLRSGVRTMFGGPFLRIGGVKLYADGSFGARTAALKEPYSDAPSTRGALLQSASGLRSAVRLAEASGLQLLVHAIGDRAVSQATSAFKAGLGRPTRLRHRLEHLEMASAGELDAMEELGLWASMQPNFVGEWGLPGGMLHSRLGERFRTADPMREVLRAGVPLVFGSDCMPFSPLYGIHCAVNAPFPAQRLTVRQALAAYTSDAAGASFEEDLKGTLAVGRAADLAVLSEDPFRAPCRIKDIRVEMTVLDGRPSFGA